MPATEKQIVLVTGANTGLGLEIVRKLLRQHGNTFHVLVGCRTLSKGQSVVAELQKEGHESVEAVHIDVTDDASIAAAAKEVAAKHGRLDVLHANAGIAPDLDQVGKTPISKLIMKAMETNVAGAASTVEHFIPLLEKADNPRVIFMSTGMSSAKIVHDFFPNTEWPSYSCSKAALNMIMLYYYHRFPKWKINACSPGFRATNLNGFGRNSRGNKPGPLEEGAFNAVRLTLLGKDGETGTHTELEGKDGYKTVPW